MTFLSRAGHPEGAGNEVTFQIYESAVSGGRTRLALVVDAAGPYNGPAGRLGPFGRSYARETWRQFAGQLNCLQDVGMRCVS